MFNLEHRIAELRPSNDELRTARLLREASLAARQPGVVTTRRWLERTSTQARLAGPAAS